MGQSFEAQDIDAIMAFARRHRSAALARLTSSLAHMAGTPLQVIQGRLFLLEDAGSPEAAREQSQAIAAECAKLGQALNVALSNLRLPVGSIATKPLGPLLAAATGVLDAWARCRRVTLRVELPPDAALSIETAQFQQAVEELIVLALPYVRPDSELLITGQVADAAQFGLPASGPVLRLALSWEGSPFTVPEGGVRAEPWFVKDVSSAVLESALGWLALSELLRHRGAKVEPSNDGCFMLWPEDTA